MSTTAQKTKPNNTPAAPPDEAFWVKYSPHHEAPVSGVSSMAVHALVIGLGLLVWWFNDRYLSKENEPVRSKKSVVEYPDPVDKPKIRLAHVPQSGDGKAAGNPGGGGGSRRGKTDGTGGLFDPANREKGDPTGKDPVNDPKTKVEYVALSPTQVERLIRLYGPNVEVVKVRPNVGKMLAVGDKLADQLRKGVNPSLGKGGPGTGGGRDKGDGPGQGSGKDKGAGTGQGGTGNVVNEREERMLRWSMTFRTTNGNNYAAQLKGLGAILATPTPDDQYRVYHPEDGFASGAIEDVTKFNRIFWIDEKFQSVASLSRALGWRPAPKLFVAFFPQVLEKRLFEIEMAAARRKNGGREIDEHRIDQTYFDVVPKGGNKFDVQVRDVIFKR